MRKFPSSLLYAAAWAASLTLATPLPGLATTLVDNGAEIVKSTDWSKMETVTVTTSEYAYEPNQLRFKVGRPYKLVMKNVGEKDHYFTAPEFFRAVATRKAQSKDGEVKAPYFLAFEMRPKGGELEFYFVPVIPGQYPVYCTIDDHRQQGSEGTLIIE
ncbi:MAG: hypothetical protein HQL88_01680 [Magnetococcales bacterium]|nr:hypothetical protein [Magnetococcales bacterium]